MDSLPLFSLAAAFPRPSAAAAASLSIRLDGGVGGGCNEVKDGAIIRDFLVVAPSKKKARK